MMTKFETFLVCAITALLIVTTALTVVVGETSKRVENIERYFGIEQVVTDSVMVGLPAEFEFDAAREDFME